MTVTQLPRQNSVRNGKMKARFEQVEEIRNRIQRKALETMKRGNGTFYERNGKLGWRETGWIPKDWRSGVGRLKKISEEEKRVAGTVGNVVGRMAPYREKRLSKPRPFLRKTKIDALLIPCLKRRPNNLTDIGVQYLLL